MRSLRLRLALLTISAFALAGCSSGSSHHTAASSTVRVKERDFRITVSPARVRAGTIRVLVRNQGPETHELLVVRSSSSSLPLRSDGLTVNEAALDRETVGVVEGKAPGSVEELVLHLKPGRYELFCNMAGHYLGGMRAQLVVT